MTKEKKDWKCDFYAKEFNTEDQCLRHEDKIHSSKDTKGKEGASTWKIVLIVV